LDFDFEFCFLSESKVETRPNEIKDYAYDPESAARLWDISSKLVGLQP